MLVLFPTASCVTRPSFLERLARNRGCAPATRQRKRRSRSRTRATSQRTAARRQVFHQEIHRNVRITSRKRNAGPRKGHYSTRTGRGSESASPSRVLSQCLHACEAYPGLPIRWDGRHDANAYYVGMYVDTSDKSTRQSQDNIRSTNNDMDRHNEIQKDGNNVRLLSKRES